MKHSFTLSNEELLLKKDFIELKNNAGTHSPSVFQILKLFGKSDNFVDACFLSNPYATDLFFQYLKTDLLENLPLIREKLEYYPSQNCEIAENLSKYLSLNSKRIFIGNGATEVIQAILNTFTQKIIVNIPTFSPYYEFVEDPSSVIFFQLKQEEDFVLDINSYISFIKNSDADSIVLINPNNPDGSFIKKSDVKVIVERNKHLQTIIIDESFIHFSSEPGEKFESFADESINYDNVIIIKSISKDFGIAGIRSGYAIMNETRVSNLLKRGYLWNSNGLSEYFFELLCRPEFIMEYEIIRNQYNALRQPFIDSLNLISGIKVYPSKANFVLIELIDGTSSLDLVIAMLNRYGVYLRTGNDKIGLNGEFIRIAIRSKETNQVVLNAFKDLYGY